MVGKRQNMDFMWKILQKEIDLEDPTPSEDQVYSGCTEREAKVDPQAVQSKNIRWKRSPLGAMIGKSCRICFARYCESAQKDVSSLQQVATPCIDDHQIPPGDYETTGEFTAVCAQIVMKCLYLADFLWSVNTLAR